MELFVLPLLLFLPQTFVPLMIFSSCICVFTLGMRQASRALLPAHRATQFTQGAVIIAASTLSNPVIRCLGCDCPIVRWIGLIILFSYSGNFVPINYFSLNSNSWLSLERN